MTVTAQSDSKSSSTAGNLARAIQKPLHSSAAPHATDRGAIARAARAPHAASPYDILALQRTAGNSAVAQLLQRAPAVPRSVSVQRDRATDLTELAEAGEANSVAGDAQQQSVNQPPAMRVSNIRDIQAARALVSQIEGWRANMREGASAGGAFTVSGGRVTPAKIAANETAISLLDDYLVTAGEQSRTVGSFQDALQRTRTNHARLQAQVTHLTVTNAVSGGTAGQIGQQIVQGAGFADPGAAQEQMRRMERNPALLAVHNQVQDAHDQMVGLGEQVGQKQSTVSQNAYAYNGALNNFKTGIPTVNDNPDQARERQQLIERIENVKKYVGKALAYAGKGLERAGVPGAGTVGEHAGVAVDWLTDQFYDNELNGIQAMISQYRQAHGEHAVTANLDDVRAKSRAFTGAITEFNNAVAAFAHAQTTFREKLRAFGASADSGHSDRYAQIASVLAEVDTYVVQIDDTLRLAYQEQTAAREAAASRRTLEGRPPDGDGRGARLPYYEPYRWFHINGGWGYECLQHELHLSTIGDVQGSASGVANVGVNETVDNAVRDLQELRAEADSMRRALAQAMNLRMDQGMPVAPGGPAPTSRSESTGL